MSGPAADALTPLFQTTLRDGASLSPQLDVVGGLVRNSCNELAQAAMGSYQREGASSKTAAVSPPTVRWGYASITKTLVGVVMQMLMANETLPQISWNDKLHQWLPLAAGTAYENASLLDVASHTACLISQGAPRSQELILEGWQQYTVGGIPAARAVYVNNSLHHPPLPNCTPELNTETTYVHFDGVEILALIEETISGLDFRTLTKTLIFDPLGMSSAEVVDGNAAGGLRSTLTDLGLYGQWLLDGYNNQQDAIAKTGLTHQDFVDLLSPIHKHGLQQIYGRTFRIYSFDGRRAAGHGGCLGASFDVLLDDNLVMVLAFTPEDASWKTCDLTDHFAVLLWPTVYSMYSTFTACDRRPSHLCNATPVDSTALTCKLTENFSLDSSTLDVPFKKTSCRAEDFADRVKETLPTYLATYAERWGKAFVVLDDCQWAIVSYWPDPCVSMRESFKLCTENNWECGVYMVGNHTYNPSDFPCRCGVFVPGSCSQQPPLQCGSGAATADINTTCLLSGPTPATSSATTEASGLSTGTSTAPTSFNASGNGLASASGQRSAVLSLTFWLVISLR
ncbi:pyrBI [Symbiodinium sp. CCMP2456]|nr:pyrBI [Symbiodinium sp. CCMP2456]